MLSIFKTFLIAATIAVLAALPAQAHLGMTVDSHEEGGLYLTTSIRVPHGCKNANGSPTRAITVTIPQEILSLQAEYIPGWNTTVSNQELSEPQELSPGGRKVTSRVHSVKWEGGPIPSGQFMDFSMRVFIPEVNDGSKKFYFPIKQECEQGLDSWDQIPGTDGYDASKQHDAPYIHIGESVDTQPWIENRSGAGSINNGGMAFATIIFAALAAFHLA